jgi:hypothetical protein
VKLSLRRNRRVQLSHRSCRGISRVRKQRFPPYFPFPVQFLELVRIDIDLAADVYHIRDVHAFDLERYGLDGLDVRRDILAFVPVAAGRRSHKESLLVGQLHRKAVEFRLDGVFHFTVRLEEAFYPLVEFPDLLVREGIAERQHGLGMFYFFEFIEGRSPHASGGRIGKDILVRFLEFLQPPEQLVEFSVGDNGSIKDVVTVIMLINFFNETFHFMFDLSWYFFHEVQRIIKLSTLS